MTTAFPDPKGLAAYKAASKAAQEQAKKDKAEAAKADRATRSTVKPDAPKKAAKPKAKK